MELFNPANLKASGRINISQPLITVQFFPETTLKAHLLGFEATCKFIFYEVRKTQKKGRDKNIPALCC
jgi:hypothetical protein